MLWRRYITTSIKSLWGLISYPFCIQSQMGYINERASWWEQYPIELIYPPGAHPAITQAHNSPGSRVHGTNMGPTWVLSAPGGPHVGPMNLAIRECWLLRLDKEWTYREIFFFAQHTFATIPTEKLSWLSGMFLTLMLKLGSSLLLFDYATSIISASSF